MLKTPKIEKLEKEIVDGVLDGFFKVTENDKYIQMIVDRCHYIVTTIWDIQGKLEKLSWWDFDNEGGKDGPSGYFDRQEYSQTVGYNCGYSNSFNMLYSDYFPTNWLYNDFEDYLIQSVNKAKEQEAQKAIEAKEKANNKQTKNKLLVKSALLKLTKDEINALRDYWKK